MKATLFALFAISFSLLGAEPKVINSDKLQTRVMAGVQLFYIPNQEIPFTGKGFGYWPSGEKRDETNYKDGKLDGLKTSWHKNGQKMSETNFKDGKWNGLFTLFYIGPLRWRDGQKIMTINYKDGKRDGLPISYNEDGTERGRKTYKDGKPGVDISESNKLPLVTPSVKSFDVAMIDLDDPATLDKILAEAIESEKLQWRGERLAELCYAPKGQAPYTGWMKTMREDGQIKEVTQYKDGKRDGLWTEWYENGQKAKQGCYSDSMLGLFTWWYENGHKKEEGNHKDGMQHGIWTTWYENGQKRWETNFGNGAVLGLCKMWYQNGQKMSEVYWERGKKSAVSWKPNGVKCLLTNLKDGNGVLILYNEDGSKKLLETFREGEKHGLEALWLENGRKEREGNWKNGKLDGTWTKYNDDGTEAYRTTYKDGVVLQHFRLTNQQSINPIRSESKPMVVQLTSQDIFGGKFHEVRVKLEKGADPDAILLPKGKRTALHCSCMGGRVNIVKLLLDGGASPNALDKYNMTPLDILFSPDFKGRAPLDRMSAENQLEIQRILEKAGGKRGGRLP
jgi:antitoxin component YwqK of YwqJK toxin-antitoxin module